MINSMPIIISISLFWCFIIFNLDRYIVSSISNSNNFLHNSIKVLPRIVVAIIIALSISKPIEVKLFQNEISDYLNKNKLSEINILNQKFEPLLNQNSSERNQLISTYNQKLSIQENYYYDYKCECDGTCGTNIRGRGVECLSKKSKYDNYTKQMEFERSQHVSNLNDIKIERDLIQKEFQEQKKILEASFSLGFFNQVKILNKLENNSIYFLMLIFIFIELSPIFIKLFSGHGPYESLLQGQIKRYESNYLKILDELKSERERLKILQDINTKNEIDSYQIEVKRKINEEAVLKYEKLKEKLKQNYSSN